MGHRVPLWLPYLQSVKTAAGGVFEFIYKGGEEHVRLEDISAIMIYGRTEVSLPISFMEKVGKAGIPIIIHRRNIAQPIVIHGSYRNDVSDTITAQIVARESEQKSRHIARQLLLAKFSQMSYLIEPEEIPPHASVEEMRNIEAKHAKRYWQKFYEEIGHPEWTRRGTASGKNPATDALNAASKFLSGITLRWVLYHSLSPFHGYLHVTSEYPALIYDLMEPYRGIFDFELLRLFKENGHAEDKWVSMAITTLKEKLNSRVYVPMTRQIVTYHELLHGSVLSLKYYLLGKQRKFHVPLPGKPKGGRPPKLTFKLYGRTAGKTDFWAVAREVSEGMPQDEEY